MHREWKLLGRRQLPGLIFSTTFDFAENVNTENGSIYEIKEITDNDRYSGHGYSGIHRYSGTKNPDDAILFTVSGITAIVEQNFWVFSENLYEAI